MSVLARGANVVLRDGLPSDADQFVHWLSHGEWRHWDGPWEGIRVVTTEEQAEKDRQSFIRRYVEETAKPRQRAIIASSDGRPLGWVNRYGREHLARTAKVGIDICEDLAPNRGVGTEALRLWVSYLFAHSHLHRIGLDTWSFNERMIRVAEKVGFSYEGAEGEAVRWQGAWLDLLHFGILRAEWEST